MKGVQEAFDNAALDYDDRRADQTGVKGLIEGLRIAIVDEMIPHMPIAIIDLGSATSYYASKWDKKTRYLGLDISSEMIKIAHKRGVDVVRGSFERAPVKNEKFDLVLIINSIQYAKAPDIAVAEAARIVSPKGKIVLTFPNALSPRGILSMLRIKVKRMKGLENRYTISDINEMCKKNSLRICEIRGFNFLPWNSGKKGVPSETLNFFGRVDSFLSKTIFGSFGGEIIMSLTRET